MTREGAPTALMMGPSVFGVLAAAAQSGAAVERCGILLGSVDEEGVAWCAGAGELENVAKEPAHQYAFDPEVQARAWERVEAAGFEVLGIWHTHPTGTPEGPSTTDLEYAQPWLLYVVSWPRTGAAGISPFVLDESGEHGYKVVAYTVTEEAATRAQQIAASKAVAADRERFGMPEPLNKASDYTVPTSGA